MRHRSSATGIVPLHLSRPSFRPSPSSKSLYLLPVPILVPLSVLLTPNPVACDVAVVIDVLRFTTSAACALANGARSIVPCGTLQEAQSHAGRALLAGERTAVRPDGFDLGNPLWSSRERRCRAGTSPGPRRTAPAPSRAPGRSGEPNGRPTRPPSHHLRTISSPSPTPSLVPTPLPPPRSAPSVPQ